MTQVQSLESKVQDRRCVKSWEQIDHRLHRKAVTRKLGGTRTDRQHHRWREAGVVQSSRWTHGGWPWARQRTQAFCPLHRTISVKGWGVKHSGCSGWSPLQKLSSWLWNTSLSWLPSYLPGCSFSVYPFLLSSSLL